MKAYKSKSPDDGRKYRIAVYKKSISKANSWVHWNIYEYPVTHTVAQERKVFKSIAEMNGDEPLEFVQKPLC